MTLVDTFGHLSSWDEGPVVRAAVSCSAPHDQSVPLVEPGAYPLRSLSFACFAFNGTQAVFVAYFVTYMTSQGHPLVAAGSLY